MAGSAMLAVGVIVAGWLLSGGIRHFKDSERVVTVKGLAEREVKADRVIWPLSYKEVGNDMLALYNAMESANAKIVGFLKSNGIAESEIYNVTGVVTVTTTNVEQVLKLMSRQSDLLKQGVAIASGDYRYTPRFIYTSDALNALKPAMIEEATRNARAAADKFAHDSNSELGKIKSASQGLFSISDRDDNTPSIKTIRVVTTVEYYLKD